MVEPGRSFPSRSAASIILTAIRSLTEPPGFRYSTFASTSGRTPSVTRDSLSSGVFPTSSISEFTYSTGQTLGAVVVAHQPASIRRGLPPQVGQQPQDLHVEPDHRDGQ